MLKASSYLNLFFNQIPRVFACNSNTLFYFHLCVLRFLKYCLSNMSSAF